MSNFLFISSRSLPILYFLVLVQFSGFGQVPNTIKFADLTLTIDKDGQERIQSKITSLSRNTRYFQLYIDRCKTYFPVIENAFKASGVPDDFKYLALQESALIGDAVSRSNAVGYWQFKQITALSLGLRVDEQIDERKNILSASQAASKYLRQNNVLIKNWILTLLSYNLGLKGSMQSADMKQINEKYFKVGKNTHVYIIHFLAHKLAFEKAYKKSAPADEELMLYTLATGKDIKTIAQQFKISETKLILYNKWLQTRLVPNDKVYNFIIPIPQKRRNEVLALGVKPIKKAKKAKIKEELEDSEKKITDNTPFNPPKLLKNKTIHNIYENINGLPAIITGLRPNLVEITYEAKIKQKRFLFFNDINLQIEIVPNQVYYLKRKYRKSKTADYHQLKERESLWEVAQLYAIRLSKLKRLNRIKDDNNLQPGRILNLKKKRKRQTPIEYKALLDSKKDETILKPDKDKVSIKIPSEGEIVEVFSTKQNKKVNLKNNNFHLVKQGETVFSICKLYNLDVLELKKINNLPNDLSLKESQILILYRDPNENTVAEKNPLAETILIDDQGKSKKIDSDSVSNILKNKKEIKNYPPPKTSKIYRAKQSETLKNISIKYNIPLIDLVKWNDIDGEIALKEGFPIYLNDPKPIISKPKEANKDSVSSINFDIDNNKSNKTVLKRKPQKRKSHTVKKNETLYRISVNNKVSVDNIKLWNKLKSNTISIGQKLWIVPPLKTSSSSFNIKNVDPNNIHYVKKGETIYDIGIKYNIHITDLRRINQLDLDNILEENQKIMLRLPQEIETFKDKQGDISKVNKKKEKRKITKQARNSFRHKVKYQETLYGISRKYNVKVDSIKKWNKLISSTLDIKQELIIYQNSDDKNYQLAKMSNSFYQTNRDNKTHTVKKGETLYAISRKYEISIQTLLKLNHKKNNIIKVGEVLKVQ